MTDDSYEYGGARALVALHDRYLRECLATWRRADEQELVIHDDEDPDYASREALLVHVLACARGYLTWICEQLELPDPGIEKCPGPEDIKAHAEEFMEKVLHAWQGTLQSMTGKQAYTPAYESRWGTPYCIDAMMEHAVMHPIRHSHQLEIMMASGHV